MSDDGRALRLDAGVPLHRQLFLVLRDEIARGAIDAGDALPTEQALCDQFKVSRITVRRALTDLTDQGYIERRQGVGSFVRARPASAADRVPGCTLMDELRQTQFETEAQLIEYGMRVPPESVRRRIGLAAEALYVMRVRRERRTQEPLMVTEAWLPADTAQMIPRTKLEHDAALYELLLEAGVLAERVLHSVTAEIAGPQYAQLLDTDIGAALLRVDQVALVAQYPHHLVSVLLSSRRSRILVDEQLMQSRTIDGFAIAHDVSR